MDSKEDFIKVLKISCEEINNIKLAIKINGIFNIVVDYYWHYPSQFISFPIKDIECDHFLIENGIDIKDVNIKDDEDNYEIITNLTEKDIGRIGYTINPVASEASYHFMIVWIHYTGAVFGVVLLNNFFILKDQKVVEVLDSENNNQIKVHLIKCITHSVFEKQPHNSSCQVLYPINPKSQSKYNFIKKYSSIKINTWRYGYVTDFDEISFQDFKILDEKLSY